MKTKGWISALFSVFAFTLLAGCGAVSTPQGKVDEVTLEYGETVDFKQYFQGEDTLASVKLFDKDGKKISLEEGAISLRDLGEYTLYHENGDRLLITVIDTQGPALSMRLQKAKYCLDEPIDLSVRCLDATDGDRVEVDTSVWYDGQEIEVVDGAFVPTRTGEYEVIYMAKDSLGNQSVATYSLKVEKYYPSAFDKQSISVNKTLISGSAEFSQGEEIILGKSYARYDITKKGWANITLTGKDLKPYTKYEVTVDYNAREVEDSDTAFSVYLSEKCYTLLCRGERGEKSITFSVTTNAKGEYYWGYDSVYFPEEMSLFFTKVTEKEVESYTSLTSYTFGRTTMKIDPIDGAELLSYKASDENGNYFVTKRLSATDKGHAKLTLSGMLYSPNTTYTFVLRYAWADSADKNFAFFVLGTEGENVALGFKNNSQVEFTVTTDALGRYEVTYPTLSIGRLGEVRWLDLYNKAEEKGSVYGTGVSVTATCKTGGSDQKMFTEGEYAGYTRTYMNFTTSGEGTLTISANQSAGLKANTSYKVCLRSVVKTKEGTGGRYYPSGKDANSWSPVYEGESVKEFVVTTDENGAFTLAWSMYYSNLEYVDFVGVEIVELTE